MPEVQIRRANSADIPGLARLWQEKMTVQQQSNRRYRMAPDAAARWSQAAALYLDDPLAAVFVAQRGNELVGYVVLRCEASPPGLLPEQIGKVVDMAVGLHSDQNGLGRRLWDSARSWFTAQSLTRVEAHVPRFMPVEQAFWRAMGAIDVVDVLWMKL